ncbi:MAG: T9SS type A sorting domain-containing protein [Saprospiraceae bacterium]|nr:T9SS type A sorting domain-containing protein [Saprospiraceae bacterium]
MRKLLLCAVIGVCLLLQFHLVGQTCTSVRNGSASNAMTWGGTTPGTCDHFVINHLVTFTGTTTITNGSITVNGPNGVIVFGGGANIELINSQIIINSGATIVLNGDIELDNTPLIVNSGGSLSGSGSVASGGFTYPGDGTFQDIVNAGGLQVGGALPIELVSFLGKRVDNGIQLTWRTITEYNNQFMEVQRSQDGKIFESLKQVPGKTGGFSSAPLDYHVIDEQPLPGVNYYRLRQVDFDGKAHYHQIIAVLFNDKDKQQAITVFPTIVSDQVNIALSEEADSDGVLYISDLNGKLFQNMTFERGAQQWSLDVKSLPEGQYIILIKNGREVQVVRFVKI